MPSCFACEPYWARQLPLQLMQANSLRYTHPPQCSVSPCCGLLSGAINGPVLSWGRRKERKALPLISAGCQSAFRIMSQQVGSCLWKPKEVSKHGLENQIHSDRPEGSWWCERKIQNDYIYCSANGGPLQLQRLLSVFASSVKHSITVNP